MAERDRGIVGELAGGEDPRLAERYLRAVPGDDGEGDVVLVGVVHDHPASVHRARSVVERVDPGVVAVELPPLAVPLFERTAEEGSAAFGDEMSGALAAAGEARTVGVDGLDREFLRTLAGVAREDEVPPSTLARTLGDLTGVARQVLSCRLAAIDPFGVLDSGVGESYPYDATPADDPPTQADDERRHVSRSSSLLRAVERPRPARLIDDTRERSMARKLRRLRPEGTVVAVVGFDHLDRVADLVAGAEPSGESSSE